MKKYLVASLLILFPGLIHAEHLNLRNASKLTRGTLPNERLDPSSVTLRGNFHLDFSSSNNKSQRINAIVVGGSAISGFSFSGGTVTLTLTDNDTGGSGGGVSSFTHTMGFGGPPFLSTTVANIADTWIIVRDSINITGMQAFVNKASTVDNTVASIVRSTGSSGNQVFFEAIHSSSLTITTNTTASSYVTPDTFSRILAGQRLHLMVTAIPGSGNLPIGPVRVVLYYWPESQ